MKPKAFSYIAVLSLSLLVKLSDPHSGTIVSDTAGAAGYVRGKVWFTGLPCQSGGSVPPCEGPYPGYTVIVYEADGTTVAAQGTTDADGNYCIGLPAGDYICYAPSGPFMQRAHAIRIEATKTTTLDLTITTGIASDSAPRRAP